MVQWWHGLIHIMLIFEWVSNGSAKVLASLNHTVLVINITIWRTCTSSKSKNFRAPSDRYQKFWPWGALCITIFVNTKSVRFLEQLENQIYVWKCDENNLLSVPCSNNLGRISFEIYFPSKYFLRFHPRLGFVILL